MRVTKNQQALEEQIFETLFMWTLIMTLSYDEDKIRIINYKGE
jgi:hypothetical protein